MKNKNMILTSLAVLLVVLMISASGCDQKNTQPGTNPFIGGTTGLTLSFMPGFPPEYVYDGGQNQFYISVQLDNMGEWEVKKEDVFVRILGLDPSEFGVTDSDLIRQPFDDLLPMTKLSDSGEIQAGGMVMVEFPEMNYAATALSDLPSRSVVAKACYLYGTNAVSQLCVKKNPLDNSATVCTVEGLKTLYTSGAPVQVQNFRQSQVGKNRVGFSFKIQKIGTGKVYEKSTKCGLETTPRENRVWVEVSAQGWDGIRCNNLQGGSSGMVQLPITSGEKSVPELTVICTKELDIVSDYPKDVTIKLMYDYEEDVSTQLSIRHTVV